MHVHIVTTQDPDGFTISGVYGSFQSAAAASLRVANIARDTLHAEPCTDRNGDCPKCAEFDSEYKVRVHTEEVAP
jgi:hypothetical protein